MCVWGVEVTREPVRQVFTSFDVECGNDRVTVSYTDAGGSLTQMFAGGCPRGGPFMLRTPAAVAIRIRLTSDASFHGTGYAVAYSLSPVAAAPVRSPGEDACPGERGRGLLCVCVCCCFCMCVCVCV